MSSVESSGGASPGVADSGPDEVRLSELHYYRCRCFQLEREIAEAKLRLSDLEEKLWRLEVAGEFRLQGSYRLDMARRLLVRTQP